MNTPILPTAKAVVLYSTMLLLACVLAAASEIKTGFIPLKAPIPVDRVPAPSAEEISKGAPNTTPNLTSYQQAVQYVYKGATKTMVSLAGHPVQMVGDPRIVIEDGRIMGWNVDYKEGDPVGITLRYSRFENPFILPEDMSEKSVLDSTWAKMKKSFPDYPKSRPVCLNLRPKNGQTVVCGLWYMLAGNTSSRYDRAKNRFTTTYSNQAQRDRVLRQVSFGQIPLPDIVVSKPQLIYSSSNVEEVTVSFRSGNARESLPVDSGDSVVMSPVKVQGEWVRLKAIVETDKKGVANGKMKHLEVVDVTPGTPFDRAGLRPGDMITEYQGVKAAGKDPLEFDSLVSALPFGNKLTVDFKDPAGQRRRLNVIAGNIVSSNIPRD